MEIRGTLGWLWTPHQPALPTSNAWNSRKWTNTCKKQNFIQSHPGWWHGKSLTCHLSPYIFRIHENKQVKFQHVPLFHHFHPSSWDNFGKETQIQRTSRKTQLKPTVFFYPTSQGIDFHRIPDLRSQLVQSFAQLISIFLRSWLTRHLDSGWLAPTELKVKVKVVVTPSCCFTIFFWQGLWVDSHVGNM